MLKTSLIALATVIGANAIATLPASAIDNGPCDHCTMDPIVVKGERPKKKKTQTTNTQQVTPTQTPQLIVR